MLWVWVFFAGGSLLLESAYTPSLLLKLELTAVGSGGGGQLKAGAVECEV